MEILEPIVNVQYGKQNIKRVTVKTNYSFVLPNSHQKFQGKYKAFIIMDGVRPVRLVCKSRETVVDITPVLFLALSCLPQVLNVKVFDITFSHKEITFACLEIEPTTTIERKRVVIRTFFTEVYRMCRHLFQDDKNVEVFYNLVHDSYQFEESFKLPRVWTKHYVGYVKQLLKLVDNTGDTFYLFNVVKVILPYIDNEVLFKNIVNILAFINRQIKLKRPVDLYQITHAFYNTRKSKSSFEQRLKHVTQLLSTKVFKLDEYFYLNKYMKYLSNTGHNFMTYEDFCEDLNNSICASMF